MRVGSRPDLWLFEAMTRYERGRVFWNLGGPSQPILLACPVDPGQEADRAERGLAGQLVVGPQGTGSSTSLGVDRVSKFSTECWYQWMERARCLEDRSTRTGGGG